MPINDRTGRVLTTGKLGRVKCLRQELLHPMERVHAKVRGRIRLGALREQETLPVHAHIEAYLTPVRWLEPNWISYVTEGVDTAATLTTEAIGNFPGGNDYLGVGALSLDTAWAVWRANYLRVYNEYWKWPEDADATAPATGGTDDEKHGLRAVNLPTQWTRWMSHDDISDDNIYLDTEAGVGSREKFSLQELAKASAELRVEMSEEYFSSSRYREFLQNAWNAAGSREADQVPISVGFEAATMGAQNLWAYDEPGLGAIAGVHQFDVDQDFGVVTAPEHVILSYFLCIRALPVLESAANPFLTLDDVDWAELVGHPSLLANMPPKEWKERQVVAVQGSSNALGYAPAGHQWRVGWDNVGPDVQARNSFLTYDDTVLPNWKYHQDLDRAFRSTQLGHFLINVECGQMSDSQIPVPGASIMAGASL